MVEYRQQHSEAWLQHFARRGHPAARPLASGVEGAVYLLGDGTVGKVWSGRPPADFDLTRQVYADIARCRPPFATPEILDTEEVAGVLVTYERELPGAPIGVDSADVPAPRVLPASVIDAVLDVLRGLAAVPATDAMRRLTVQGDDRPLRQGRQRFSEDLADLVERAGRRHGAVLAAHVPDLAKRTDRTARELRALPDTADAVIHGDLVPPNIHVDGDGRPVAVLDFGFFTTAGDPAFEAAVTAAVWDMYGPHAREHTESLTRVFASELGYEPDTLALYQTAYALTTYDLFSADGSDGHFHWCAALLNAAS
jgi:hypothetical protein